MTLLIILIVLILISIIILYEVDIVETWDGIYIVFKSYEKDLHGRWYKITKGKKIIDYEKNN